MSRQSSENPTRTTNADRSSAVPPWTRPLVGDADVGDAALSQGLGRDPLHRARTNAELLGNTRMPGQSGTASASLTDLPG